MLRSETIGQMEEMIAPDALRAQSRCIGVI